MTNETPITGETLITDENRTNIIEINKNSIFFTFANINFNTMINSIIASLWVTKQEFFIDIKELSKELTILNIKNLRVIHITNDHPDVQIDKMENIYIIKF